MSLSTDYKEILNYINSNGFDAKASKLVFGFHQKLVDSEPKSTDKSPKSDAKPAKPDAT